jgi:integrase
MSRKYSHQTSDVLFWTDAINLINRLERDENWKMVLFFSISISFGTRVSDTLSFKWNQLLTEDLIPKEELVILEMKTKKTRKIKINPQLGRRIVECYNHIKPSKLSDNILISNKKTVYSIQRLNVILKELKVKYKVDISNFSCHSLRKCFAREIYEQGERSEYMLLKLSIILNHSSISLTRIYIGIQDVEIANAYELLSF